MHLLTLGINILLAGYIAWEVARFLPQYRQLKEALAQGDTQARMRVYRRALVFEWVSALLAIVAIGFDWSKLTPAPLGLNGSQFARWLPKGGDFDWGVIGGMFFGVALGTAAIVVARLRASKAGTAVLPAAPMTWWRRLIPDFSALIPVTGRERWVWVAVAISAGVCEEVVFRGWLLSTLRQEAGLGGATLIAVAAVLFGCAHAYQGISGMVLTGIAAAIFCALYVGTGSLLAPILLHILIDVRFAVLPTPQRARSPQNAYA